MTLLYDADVHMIRLSMSSLPVWHLPEGYRFRAYREGELDVWVALHVDAEPHFRVTREHFVQSFGAHPEALRDRMWFVQSNAGQDVGSITAWWEDDWQGRGAWGQIHWVIVARAHQRRGLAKPMVARALRRIALEHTRAMLGTNTLRPWAIKCYLDCGFVPDPAERTDVNAQRGWQALQTVLHHPAIDKWLND